MRTMLSRMAFTGLLLVAPGCGCLVGHREYIDTAMAQGASDGEIFAYVAPEDLMPSDPPVDRSGLVLSTDLRLDGAGGTIPAGPVSRLAISYRSDVRRQIEALTRQMRVLEARAEMKGAPSKAALEPHLRAFNSAIDRLDARISGPDVLADVLDVQLALDAAHQAADDAAGAVNRTRALGENHAGT